MADAVPVTPRGAEDGGLRKSRGPQHRVEATLEVDGRSPVRTMDSLGFDSSCPLATQPGTLNSGPTRQGRTAEPCSKSKETRGQGAKERRIWSRVFRGTQTGSQTNRRRRPSRDELKLRRFRSLGLESSDVVEDLSGQRGRGRRCKDCNTDPPGSVRFNSTVPGSLEAPRLMQVGRQNTGTRSSRTRPRDRWTRVGEVQKAPARPRPDSHHKPSPKHKKPKIQPVRKVNPKSPRAGWVQ